MSQPTTTRTSTSESFTIVEKSRNSDMSISTGSYETAEEALAVIEENPSWFGKIGEVSIVKSTVTEIVTVNHETIEVVLPA